MKTITVLHSRNYYRIMHYARLAFLSGASTAFLCHSGLAQENPDHAVSADNGNGKGFTYMYKEKQHAPATNTAVYHAVAESTGPSSQYNITGFVNNTLPLNRVQFSDNTAGQLNNSAQTLSDYAHALTLSAKEARTEARQAATRWQAVALCKKADSLDVLASVKMLEASKSLISANESQFEANTNQITGLQKSVSYSNDELTSANLLVQDAGFWYNKSLTEINQANASTLSYISQGYSDAALKDMQTAVLKQQAAENIFISLQHNNSVSLAQKIDSILITNQDIAASNAAHSFGNIVFCVQVGSYSKIVPIDKANKLLKIAGLGITKHIEENGVTTFTIGNYTSSCSTCAAMLNQELVEDGYAESTVITYQTGNTQPDTRWVIAKK